MITSFNREIGIVVLMGYVAFKDLNEDINLLAYIVMGLAVCHMFIKYKRRNDKKNTRYSLSNGCFSIYIR